MAEQQTGKQRAARIPLDYFKKPDRIQRVKLWLTGLAVLVALGWWASTLVRSDQGKLSYSRGPVAAVHSTWNAECAACHVDFQPIGSRVGMSQVVGHASDQKCQTCHGGPPHSERQIASQVGNCADCHRDHRGVEASLVRVADSDCSRCHADLSTHVQKQFLPTRFADASRFDAKSHPEFKLHRDKSADPGSLKFNHQLHMTTGQALTAGGKNFSLADIEDPAERERYRKMQPADNRSDGAAVQLTCASCHVLDAADLKLDAAMLAEAPASALLPPRAPGAYMLPFSYENQCRACHPLTVEKGNGKTPPLTAPHRLQPEEVHQFLERTFLGRFVANNPTLLEAPFAPPRLIPGKPAPPPSPEQEKAGAAVAAQVVAAEKILFLGKQTCGECHQYTAPVGPDSFQPGKSPSFKIQPDNVPDIWFQHAKFNHTSHRALDCRDCHAAAFPDSPNPSSKASDVMIPGINNCLQCHAPPGQEGGKRVGGARFDCTECHRYHNGDAPLQGVGAAARGVRRKLSVQEFLRGHP